MQGSLNGTYIKVLRFSFSKVGTENVNVTLLLSFDLNWGVLDHGSPLVPFLGLFGLGIDNYLENHAKACPSGVPRCS